MWPILSAVIRGPTRVLEASFGLHRKAETDRRLTKSNRSGRQTGTVRLLAVKSNLVVILHVLKSISDVLRAYIKG